MTDTSTSNHTTSDHTTSTTARERTQVASARTLRLVLRLNALNSFVFGVLLAAIPSRIDDVLGTGHPGWIRLVGLGLLPFGALCAWLSTAPPAMLRRITPQIVAGDIAWVVTSVATVLLGWYSPGGIVAVLGMAAIVDVFALLQWSAWRRLQTTH